MNRRLQKTKLVPGDLMTRTDWVPWTLLNKTDGYIKTIKMKDVFPGAPIAIFIGYESQDSTKTIRIVWMDSGAVIEHNAAMMVKIDTKDFR